VPSGADPSPDGVPPVNEPNLRLLGAYALMGLGLPISGTGLFLFRLIYLPGRGGPAIAARYSTDHRAFVTAALLTLIGGAMAVAGFVLLGGRRP